MRLVKNWKTNMETSKYETIQNADGTKSLRRYNKKFDYWVNLKFNSERNDSMNNVLELLKNAFIQKNKFDIGEDKDE